MAGIGVSPTTSRQRLVLVTCALAAVVTLMVINQLNGMLAGSRVGGGVSGSVADLKVSVVPLRLPSVGDVTSVVDSWKAYDAAVVQSEPQFGYAPPLATANAVLRWDAFLLVPLYAIFLLTLLRWARSWPPAQAGQPVPRAISALGKWWFLYVVGAGTVLAAEVENFVLSRLIDQAWDGRPLDGLRLMNLAGALKWVGVVLSLAPFVVVGVRLLIPVVRPLLRTAWFAVLLLVLLGVAAMTDQAGDVIRRWGVGQTVWSLLATALLAVAMAVAGSRALQIGRTPVTVRTYGRPLTFRAMAKAGVILLPLGVLAVVALLVAQVMQWQGLVALSLLVLAAYLLSIPIRHFWHGEQTVEVPTVQTAPAPLRHRIGMVLAAVPPFLVGLAIVRPATIDVFSTTTGPFPDRALLLLVLGFLVAVGGSLVAAFAAGRLIGWLVEGGRVRRWGLLGLLLAAVGVPASLLFLRSTSLTVAQGLGATSIVLVFLAGLALVASTLYILGDSALRTRWTREAILPPAVRLLGFERPPLVGLLLVWIGIASLLSPGGYHDVRVSERLEVDVRPPTMPEVFAKWRERQPDESENGVSQPLVVVAASGGGLRSAYWTSAVLDCVLERDTNAETGDPCGDDADSATVDRRRARIFLESGVSGGSLGLVTYDTHADLGRGRNDVDWYDEKLRDDFLAPTLAWWLFRDSLAAVLRPGSGQDRAAQLERAWERPWRRDGDALAEPFLTGQSELEGPLLFLNGYTVEDGCRLSTSVFPTSGGRPVNQCGDLDPGFAPSTRLDATVDLLDFLCPSTDVRRSTAALLSARFPYISPSGTLEACAPEGTGPRGFVVDGGYRDSSAASTIVELWPELQGFVNGENRNGACLVPAFVQIDSSPDVAVAPGTETSPSQAIVPLVGLGHVPTGNAAAARVAAQRLFDGVVDDRQTTVTLNDQPLDRWFHLAPRAQAGLSAPLSWVLSKEARGDLRQQLTFNADTIERLRALLDATPEELRCESPASP